jgi:hypothetical protein
MDKETGSPNISAGHFLGKARLERLLNDSAPAPDEPSSSLYVRPGEARKFLETLGARGLGWRERLEGLDGSLIRSDTGIAALRAGGQGLVIVPPFPLRSSRLTPGWDPSPLLSVLAAEYTVGVVLLRLGRFSVAVFRGDRLLSSKTDARYVKGRHHAGGTSQLRFQRVREGQVRRMYDKTCEAVHAQFAPYARELDYLFLGGERITLSGFLKVCPYLEQFRGVTLGRRLNIRDPKRDTLKQVPAILRESRLHRFQW